MLGHGLRLCAAVGRRLRRRDRHARRRRDDVGRRQHVGAPARVRQPRVPGARLSRDRCGERRLYVLGRVLHDPGRQVHPLRQLPQRAREFLAPSLHVPSRPRFDRARDQGNNEQCTIQVTGAGLLTATSFSTEACCDHLTVDGTQFHGANGPDRIPVNAGSTITWGTDGSVTNTGFEVCIGSFFSVAAGPCTIDATGSCVRSPNFPDAHGNGEACEIEVRGTPGLLTAQRFSTEACCDAVTIDGTRYSGADGPDGVYVTPESTFAWISDGSVVNPGFEICISPCEPSCGAGAYHDASLGLTDTFSVTAGSCTTDGSGSCMRSPNFGPGLNHGNSENCVFGVSGTPGPLVSTTFSTEPCCDYVLIDGTNRFSGVEGPDGVVLTSDSTVVWASDGSVVNAGFEVCTSRCLACAVDTYRGGADDFSSWDAMQQDGWTASSGLVATMDNAAVAASCQEGGNWFGWSGDAAVGVLSFSFSEDGTAIVDFGQCWPEPGDCVLYVGGAEVARAGVGEQHVEVSIVFRAGDAMELKDEGQNPVCRLSSVQVLGHAPCTACPADSSTEGASGAKSCTCNPGFVGEPGSCVACDIDTFKAGSGTGACAACPSDSSTGGATGANACTCNADFTGSDGTAPCTACPDDSSTGGASGATSCACNPGFAGEAVSCTACAIDTFKEASGSGNCTACPERSSTEGTTAASTCTCNPGFTGNPGACTPCPTDTYKEQSGNATCTACPDGTTTEGTTGAASCILDGLLSDDSVATTSTVVASTA